MCECFVQDSEGKCLHMPEMPSGKHSSFRIQLAVTWTVSCNLALAADRRETSWCVAVAMTQANALFFFFSPFQCLRQMVGSTIPSWQLGMSGPPDTITKGFKVRKYCICQDISPTDFSAWTLLKLLVSFHIKACYPVLVTYKSGSIWST